LIRNLHVVYKKNRKKSDSVQNLNFGWKFRMYSVFYRILESQNHIVFYKGLTILRSFNW